MKEIHKGKSPNFFTGTNSPRKLFSYNQSNINLLSISKNT
jgi:hypothetical protein